MSENYKITACWHNAVEKLKPECIRSQLHQFVINSSLPEDVENIVEDLEGAFSAEKFFRANPEEKEALHASILLANEQSADILLATDPDGDRIGVGVRLSPDEKELYLNDDAVKEGYYLLNGNQQLVLLTDYVLSQLKQRDGKLPENSVIGKSIVSTDLTLDIADHYGVMTIEPHVGFKYLGEKLYLYACKAFAAAKEK